ERLRELAKRAVDLADPRGEVVEAAEDALADRVLEKRTKPAADDLEVAAQRGDVLQRSVVKVEGHPQQAPLRRADERALALAAELHERLALERRGQRVRRLLEEGRDR